MSIESKARARAVGLETSRRRFLGYSGAIVGASLLAPFYPKRARAQSVTFDFYISPTGSDSNPGTQASPWALTAINTKRGTYAGHRVGVLPGTYNCAALVGGTYTGAYDTPAFNIAGGTSGAQTVIQSTVPRGAILDAGASASNNPNGQPLIGTIGGTAGAGYITIDGFEIRNAYNRAVSIGYQTGAIVPSTRLAGMVVQNCYIHAMTNQISGANTTGITVYTCDGAVVQNNYVTDVKDSTSRGTGIEVWTSINCVVQLNTVVSLSSEHTGGIYQKNISNHSNRYSCNFVDMTLGGTGACGMIFDDDGSSSTVLTVNNNIIVGDSPVNSYLMVTGNFPASVNQQLWYNNTFVGIPGTSVGTWIRYGAPGTIKFYNNIIQTAGTGGRGQVDASTGSLALIDYNCYSSPLALGLSASGSTAYPTSLFSSIASWAAALGSAAGKDAHSLVQSPVFAATGTGAAYYKLQAASPCIGRGMTTGTTGGSATDMGAWGNGAAQVGCDFGDTVLPSPPVLQGIS